MGRFIVKTPHPIRPYLEWSTIVDAPVTYGMTVAELRDYIKDEYGAEGLRGLDARLERADTKGTSAFDDSSAEDTIACNRAGERETQLTMAQIVDFYCERRGSGPKPKGTT